MDTKSLVLKDLTAEGQVEAVVATLDIIDKDDDVTEPGFFGTQTTSMVGSHNWSDLMLGKGTVSDEEGKEAVFQGQMNLADPDAAKLHTKLRFDVESPPPLIEWSYGFTILDGGSKTGERDGRTVRVLQPKEDGSPGVKVHEVSPVIVGAGEGTRTVTVKEDKTFPDLPTDLKLSDHVAWAHAALDSLADRIEALAALRQEDGREPTKHLEELARLEAKLSMLLSPPEPSITEAHLRALVEKTRAKMRGAYA